MNDDELWLLSVDRSINKKLEINNTTLSNGHLDGAVAAEYNLCCDLSLLAVGSDNVGLMIISSHLS